MVGSINKHESGHGNRDAGRDPEFVHFQKKEEDAGRYLATVTASQIRDVDFYCKIVQA